MEERIECRLTVNGKGEGGGCFGKGVIIIIEPYEGTR